MTQPQKASEASLPVTLGWLREGVNWLVVLSSSVLVFGTGFYKEFSFAALYVKVIFIIGACSFLLTIVAGVFCYFWLNNYANQYEKIEFYRGQLESNAGGAGETNRPELDQKQKAAENQMKKARTRYGVSYKIVMWTFCAGMFFLALLLFVGVGWGKESLQSQKEQADFYMISHSAEHISPNGRRHAHTFLVNKKTGEVWQMFCVRGDEVSFRRIQVEGIPHH